MDFYSIGRGSIPRKGATFKQKENNMFGSLLKATVGLVVDLPVAIVKDTVTLGGTLIDEDSAIAKSCGNIVDNLGNAVDPDKD